MTEVRVRCLFYRSHLFIFSLCKYPQNMWCTTLRDYERGTMQWIPNPYSFFHSVINLCLNLGKEIFMQQNFILIFKKIFFPEFSGSNCNRFNYAKFSNEICKKSSWIDSKFSNNLDLVWILKNASLLCRLGKALDRETLERHVLKVSAYERLDPTISASSVVIVEVVDVQDNAPLFERNSYYAEIREDAPVISLFISVHCSAHIANPDELRK